MAKNGKAKEKAQLPLPLVVGAVGPLEVMVSEDRVYVTAGDRIITVQNTPHLSEFLIRHGGRVRVTLARSEEFDIIGMWGPDGFGYAVNLQAPECSEWGYS